MQLGPLEPARRRQRRDRRGPHVGTQGAVRFREVIARDFAGAQRLPTLGVAIAAHLDFAS
jgi:hypothetical protein